MAKKKTDVPLFDGLRLDPKKVTDGVWITHPETGDQFLCRRLWCPEHARAHLQAIDDLGDEAETPEGRHKAESIGLASGVILDWKLKDSPKRPYDASQMAAALADPELADLRNWFLLTCSARGAYRPDSAAGN